MRRRMYLAAAMLTLALGLAGCGGKSQEAANGAEAGATEASQAPEAEEGGKEGQEETQAAMTEAQKSETEKAGTEGQETSGEAAAAVNHSGFLFESSGVTMGMNEDVAPIVSGLGDYNNYAESPSCAFNGLDKIYSYNGFDLYTYPKGKKDYVNSVYFTDDTVSTPEGIRLGSTTEEMLAAYGEDYTEEYGVYTYTKEKSALSFIVTDGIIESIEYVAITE